MSRAIAVILVALALAGCKQKAPPPAYQLVPASNRDIIVAVNANGSIQPVDSVEVKSKASGEIVRVFVQTGDVVKKGEPLVRVDPRNPRNALEQAGADLEVAQAQLANARSQLKRAEDLWQTKSITEQEYENAKLQAAQAKAAVVRAQTNLENAKIAFEDTDVRAARDGVILAKNVDVGTVISSATGTLGGGTVLLKMANLDTVQVRAMVDETDIGKLQPGLDVSIGVDAYPNRMFAGRVLKIEPQSVVQQNVTMFPVLVRLPNPDHLLRPGMNTEIAITVGERHGVLAVPNSALRTQRDVASAAGVLGVSMDEVQKQLAAATAAPPPRGDGQASLGGTTRTGDGAQTLPKGGAETFLAPGGRQIALPPGLTAKRVQEAFARMRSSGGFQALSDEDRQVMHQLRSAGGGRGAFGAGGRGFGGGERGLSGTEEGPGGGASSGRRLRANSYQFGGSYIVFAMRNGKPTALPVQTGLTDLDYSEVLSGLTAKDTVLLLPSASLVASQDQMRQRMQQMSPVPGMRQGSTTAPRPAGGGPVIITR